MSTPTPAPNPALAETKGDLFASPDYSVLVHACNCRGAWGKGIAKRFRELYPAAYAIYRAHCLASLTTTTTTSPTTNENKEQKRALLGTSLLIPPQPADLPRRHWIGCLFTRFDWRQRRPRSGADGDVEEVLDATRGAVRDLLAKLQDVRDDGDGDEEGARMGEVFACRINAGLFGVEWGATRRVLGEEGVGWGVLELE